MSTEPDYTPHKLRSRHIQGPVSKALGVVLQPWPRTQRNSHLVHHIDRPGQRVAGLTAEACSSLFGSPLAAEHARGLSVQLPAIDEVWEPRGTERARLSSLLLLWYRPTVTPFRFSPARFLLPLWIQVSNRWCLRPSTAAHVPCSALPLFSKRTRQKKQAVIYLTVFQSCWL